MLGKPIERFKPKNIVTQTTTLIKTGIGFLHAITINKPLADGIITIYDNTSAAGTKIGTITLPATLLADGPKQAIYNVRFKIGLTVVTSGATQDITVSYT